MVEKMRNTEQQSKLDHGCILYTTYSLIRAKTFKFRKNQYFHCRKQ